VSKPSYYASMRRISFKGPTIVGADGGGEQCGEEPENRVSEV